jgi:putative ABC transport system permease protein
MIKNYFKIAFRSFWRHKVFTFINIIGLSIGISAALVIYLIVHFDFTFDKFEKDNDRIYRVVTNFTFSGQPGFNPGVCSPLTFSAKNEVTGLAVVAPVYKFILPNVVIAHGHDTPDKFKLQKNVAFTDKEYFSLVPYKWLAGTAKTALNDPYRVVLTSAQAKMYFPKLSYDQMLGKTVMYDTLKTTVSGIVESLHENTGFSFHDLISYVTLLSDKDLKDELKLTNWGRASVKSQLFIKLLANTSTTNIEHQLNGILQKNNPPTPFNKNKTQSFSLQPLSDIHFNSTYGGIADFSDVASKTTLNCLLVIALFLLLLGCINFINLSTAQAGQRAKEIGIRKTMGSSRHQIIVQFLSETFFITVIAVIISAFLAPVLIRLFENFIPAGIKFDLLQQPGILLFMLLLAIGVSLLSGFYPALILSGYKPVSVFKNQFQSNSGKTRNAWMRKSLTVTQFVIAQFFIMATLFVSKQIYYAAHKELGFKKDAILVINSPFKNRKVSSNLVLLNNLRTIPQVQMVSMGNDEPASENTSSTEAAYMDGKKEIRIEDLAEKFGDENYINLYHIKLLAGRNLQPTDTNRAFLVNETFVKRIGLKNPADAIGKQVIDFNGDNNRQIIGVVADFHQESLHEAIAPLVLLTSTDKYFSGSFHIALKPQTAGGNEWRTAIAGMQKAWKQVYPDDDFEYNFVDETIGKFYIKEQNTATLLSWATGLSILISCLGLLGLAIYTTSQRTKEIGVRKVLGATVTQIVALLSAELMWLIVLAFILITPIAWWAMSKWMQSFADRTTISWWIFAASGAGMLLIAMITSGFQTIQAAVANPVKSLRSE